MRETKCLIYYKFQVDASFKQILAIKETTGKRESSTLIKI